MIIIDRFLKIKTHNHLLGEKNIQHMYGCRVCGYKRMLHRHGHYDRNVVTLNQHFIISIQRFLCPSCGKTYSHLPSMLIPYFIYSYDVVIFCLNAVFTLSKKAESICAHLKECNKQCFISVQSLCFFKKRFLSKIHAVNSFFAALDSFHYGSDLTILPTDKAAAILLTKILRFDNDDCFNYEYFRKMPEYFLSS